MLAFPLSASSFALRGLEEGGQVSDIAMAGISGEGGKLSSFMGEKGLVVIYWATWSSRSPGLLVFAEKELKRYEPLGLKFLAVNADHQEMKSEEIAAVKAKAEELSLSFPVVLDAGLRGYDEIGIIGTPTTLILSPDLTLADAYPGFPSVARDDLPDRLDAFLGIVKEKKPEKTRYLLEHKPKNYALQYYNMGKMLFSLSRSPSGELHGVPGSAIDRLDEAIKRDPDFFRPYLLKAIIYDLAKEGGKRDAVLQELKGRDFQEVYEWRILGFGYLYMGMDALAADYFQLLASQAPEDPGVLFGQAVVSARQGDGASARRALSALSKNPEAARELGFEYAALFTPEGAIVPGADAELASSLGILLGIDKKKEGTLREDAPVQANSLSAAPSTPGAAPAGSDNAAPVPAEPAGSAGAPPGGTSR